MGHSLSFSTPLSKAAFEGKNCLCIREVKVQETYSSIGRWDSPYHKLPLPGLREDPVCPRVGKRMGGLRSQGNLAWAGKTSSKTKSV